MAMTRLQLPGAEIDFDAHWLSREEANALLVALLGTVPVQEKDIHGGRVVLGIFTERNAPEEGPYQVAFNDISIWPIKN